MERTIQIGDRVYLKNAIAGEPGCVVGFNRRRMALVRWLDMPELGRDTAHYPETLIVDEGFHVEQLGLEFEDQAA